MENQKKFKSDSKFRFMDQVRQVPESAKDIAESYPEKVCLQYDSVEGQEIILELHKKCSLYEP